MTVGFRPPELPRDPSRPRQLLVLWRMQGPQRVVAAALYAHPHGTELRVYFEPEERDDVLQTYYADRCDVEALEERANTLRDVLREKGWWPVEDLSGGQ